MGLSRLERGKVETSTLQFQCSNCLNKYDNKPYEKRTPRGLEFMRYSEIPGIQK